MITLICDDREKDVIAQLKKKCDFQTSHLLVGDFLINQDGQTRFCFERKTAQDYEDSIHDKRIFDQIKRMNDWSSVKCFFIIEAVSKNQFTESVTTSIRHNTLLLNLPCFFTHNIADTVQFLLCVMNDCQKYPFGKSIAPPSLVTKAPKAKNSKVPPERAFHVILTVMPQCGRKTADLITEKFPTLKSLTEALKAARPEDRHALVKTHISKVPKGLSAYLANVFS